MRLGELSVMVSGLRLMLMLLADNLVLHQQVDKLCSNHTEPTL